MISWSKQDHTICWDQCLCIQDACLQVKTSCESTNFIQNNYWDNILSLTRPVHFHLDFAFAELMLSKFRDNSVRSQGDYSNWFHATLEQFCLLPGLVPDEKYIENSLEDCKIFICSFHDLRWCTALYKSSVLHSICSFLLAVYKCHHLSLRTCRNFAWAYACYSPVCAPGSIWNLTFNASVFTNPCVGCFFQPSCYW